MVVIWYDRQLQEDISSHSSMSRRYHIYKINAIFVQYTIHVHACKYICTCTTFITNEQFIQLADHYCDERLSEVMVNMNDF